MRKENAIMKLEMEKQELKDKVKTARAFKGQDEEGGSLIDLKGL